MDKQKLEYFRNLLLKQRLQATEDLRADKATALEGNDGVEDLGEMSELDLNRSTALDLAARQTRALAIPLQLGVRVSHEITARGRGRI